MGDQEDGKKNEELVAKIRRRVALEEKAHRVVVELSDSTPSESALKTLLQSISSEHYVDIVEERSVCKLCAYPLCSNAVSDVLKQKYWISTKTKTVYDITERKKFCSNYCMAASQHLLKQIPSSPVWLREDAPPVKIDFLQKTSARLEPPGKPVVRLPHLDLAQDVQQLERLDATHASGTSMEIEDKGKASVDDEVLQDNPLPEWQSDFDRENHPAAICHKSSSQATSKEASDSLERRIKNVMELMEKKRCKQPLKICLIDIPIPKVIDPVDKVLPSKMNNALESRALLARLEGKEDEGLEQTCPRLKGFLLEWRTRETVELFSSYEKNAGEDGVWLENSSQMSTTSDELRRNNIKTWRNAQPSKEELEKEQKAVDNKQYGNNVKGFYGEKEQVDGQKEDFEVVLPPVHSCSQMALRRRIVLDKISRVLPDFINKMSLAMSCVSRPVREIVHTFNLTSKNILLKHDDWRAVGYILLKMLSLKDNQLRDQLANDALSEITRGILSSVQLSLDDVDEIICRMSSFSDEEELLDRNRQNTSRVQFSDMVEVLD